MDKKENFGEELFNLLVRVLNSPANREVFDSIRGEYGLLWILLNADGPVTVGQLCEELQVVPGRMTDILKQLEKKGMITRTRSRADRRVVEVSLLDPTKIAAELLEQSGEMLTPKFIEVI
ncbi:MAG: MarR family transcriptional regulator [Lachnospiraceae bacterium]|nr:MarR family transcriptional regulator [Lachnospiraceae bacterium]